VPFTVTEIHAFIATGKDGEEGICAFYEERNNVMLPMICADPARLKFLLPIARDIAKASGQKISLVRFSNREIIEEEI
jgi:hypothetical protein